MRRRLSLLRRIRALCLAAVILMSVVSVAASDVYIVAHRDVADKEISGKTIERIFLGKKSRWSDGVRIVPVMLKKGNLHERFVSQMLNRDASQFSTFWKQAVFTGRGLPPKSFETSKELLEYIAKTPGAVGYASSPPKDSAIIAITIQ